MENEFSKNRIALAVIGAIGTFTIAPTVATAAKTPGTYVAGDFHNHSTCSDGSTSMQKKVKKSMDRDAETPWGLDWFVQAGHGGTGNRNCTLVEDETLATPAYPYVDGAGPNTTWANSIGAANIKGNLSGSGATQNMWRWQSLEEYQYPLMEYLAAYRDEPIFLGLESVVAGHEHTSMAVISGQIPAETYTKTLPESPPYTALGDAEALAKWTYCFDRATSDTSRGNFTTGPNAGTGNDYDCSVPGSPNAADPSWDATARKLVPAGGTGTGDRGHNKTVEAMKWMAAYHPDGSYYVPAHLERAGPFNPNGNNGFNVEHLRNFNNAAPRVAFGFETQPGHHASDQRGEYTIRRNNFGSGSTPQYLDSVGGTTFGGTGVYGAQVGGVWDALLGEGRGYWFFGSSDWHNRGEFGSDDRRSTQDFWPGEYQRNYTLVRNGGSAMLSPQMIVDGLRTGNNWVASGQLVDRLAFIACASYPGPAFRSNASVEALAVAAASKNTDIEKSGCTTMGEKLKVRKGAEIVVSIVVRDPAGQSYSPYSFPNPSLSQVDIDQPLDMPVLDHVDLIRGMVTGYKTPGAADYSGAWPNDWIDRVNPQQLRPLTSVPAAAKNTSAAVIQTFNSQTWTTVAGNTEYKKMTFRIPAVQASQYVRLRGTNLPPAVPYETDANGNPLADLWTNAAAVRFNNASGNEFPANHFLRIPCTTTSSEVPGVETYNSTGIDGCPNHMPTVTNQTGVSGYPEGYTGKVVAYDVAAWADLWVYGNPIFVEVAGSTVVAGVK